jgi:hypothetical protein
MYGYTTKFVTFILLLFVAVSSYAQQSACDKLFQDGVRLQQTMTITSQKKAISCFEKAKTCYDSQAKKNLCDEQIKACRNIISQINKSKEKDNINNITETSESKTDDIITPATNKRNDERDVVLSLECDYLKFKGDGGEFKKVKVTCNYQDWKITHHPSWSNCSRNEEDEIVIEVEANEGKNERSGVLRVECGNKIVTLTIIQKKRAYINKVFKDIKDKIK